MSHKRRKISKKKKPSNDLNNSSDLDKTLKFKEAVVMLFSKEHYGKSLGRRTTWNRLMNAKRVAKWIKMSTLERIKEIGGRRGYHPRLSKMLSLLKHSTLKDFYRQHFQEEIQKGRLSKVTLIQEIKNRYFGMTGDIEKRSIEQGNVEDMGDYEEQYQFISFCNHLITANILAEILSYLGYDHNLLFSVGCVSKMVYMTVLRNWPRVKIRKVNLYRISILVLQSVREVSFVVPKDKPTETFIKSEIEYALKNLNPNRIRRINVTCMIDSYVKLLRFFRQVIRKKNFPNSNVFNNVTSFHVYTRNLVHPHPWKWGNKNMIRKSDFTHLCKPNWSGIPSLRDIFPNLQSAHGILNFRLLKGLESTLSSLLVDLTTPFTYEEYINPFAPHNRQRFLARLKFEGKVHDSIGYIGTEKRDEGVPKSRIRSLKVVFHTEDKERVTTHLPNFLKSSEFESVRFLELHCRVSDSRISWKAGLQHPTNAFDFSQLKSTTISTTLHSLILFDDVRKEVGWWTCDSRGTFTTTKKDSYFWKFPRLSSSDDDHGLSSVFQNLRVLKVVSEYFRLSDFVFCLGCSKIEDLDICTRISVPEDYDDRKSHVILMERLSSRLFGFKKAKLLLKFAEGENKGDINLTINFEKRKAKIKILEEPSCRINISFKKNEDRYSLSDLFGNKNVLCKVPLSNFPLLRIFLVEFPGVAISNGIFARFEDHMIDYFEKKNFDNMEIPEVVSSERNDDCCISIFNNSFLDNMEGSDHYTILLDDFHQKIFVPEVKDEDVLKYMKEHGEEGEEGEDKYGFRFRGRKRKMIGERESKRGTGNPYRVYTYFPNQVGD